MIIAREPACRSQAPGPDDGCEVNQDWIEQTGKDADNQQHDTSQD